MTAGSNGTHPPEGDDPFGYLYRSEDGAPPAQGQQQSGVPRTSYNQVRAVGERRNAQRPGAEQSPSPYYAAPETQPGGYEAPRGGPGGGPGGGAYGAGHGGHGGHGGGRGRAAQGGPKRNGLLIGALAVVAAVLVGVGAAYAFSDGDSDDNAGPGPGQSEQADQGKGEEQPGEDEEQPEEEKQVKWPREDASSIRLDNGPVVGRDVENSRAKDGSYIHGFKEGSTATWTVEAPKAGEFFVYVGYTVPGKDMRMSLSTNGGDPFPLRFDNFANAEEGEWEKGWTWTFGNARVKEGTNTFQLSCAKDEECAVAVDRLWLKETKGNPNEG